MAFLWLLRTFELHSGLQAFHHRLSLMMWSPLMWSETALGISGHQLVLLNACTCMSRIGTLVHGAGGVTGDAEKI